MDIYDKICSTLKASNFDALLVVGADNFNYMAGAAIPFLQLYPESPVSIFWPKSCDPTIIAPVEWEETIRDLSSIKKIKSYEGRTDAFVKASVEVIKGAKKGGQIGVDLLRVTETTLEALKKAAPEITWGSCDQLIRELRQVKTEEELALLEDISYRIDHGIFGTQHHVLVTSSRSEMSLGEEIRVHCLERGLDVVGGHSVSQGASGLNAAKWWPRAPYFGIGYEKKLQPGEYVRMDARYSLDGYWGTGTRLMTQGYPTAEQRKAYGDLTALRDAALTSIKPGSRCSEVYKTMKAEAKRRGVKLIEGLVLGHGIGVSDVEAPYISSSDDTILFEGTALIICPAIEGPQGEILQSKDTVFINNEGCSIVGWYKDWREPYVANYTL